MADDKNKSKTKVKYKRLVDSTEGELDVSQEDLKYLKQYNDIVSAVGTNDPEIFNTTNSVNYKPENQINQTAGVNSGNANADFIVSKDISKLKDAELEKYSPYFYKAGLKTVKEQKELLDNVYRITGTDIISNDYRPGLRHLVNFEYEEPSVENNKPSVENTNTTGQQNIYSKTPNKVYDVQQVFNRDAQGRPVRTKVLPKISTEEIKTIGERDNAQTLNPNYSGEFITNPQGQTNTELIEDPSINEKKKKLTYGGQINNTMKKNKNKKLYPLGGMINNFGEKIGSAVGMKPENAAILGSALSTASGLIPGMQDNLLQAGDLAGDIMKTSNNKKVANAGQTVSAMAPLLNMINLDPTSVADSAGAIGNVMGNAFAMGGDLGLPNPPTFEESLGEQNPYYTTSRDISSMKSMKRNPATTLVDHTDPKSTVYTDMNSSADVQAAVTNKDNELVVKSLWAQSDKLFTPTGLTPIKKAMGGNLYNSRNYYAEGGQLTEFEGNLHPDGGIPLGDSNNEVEGGETASKQYIYSDQIKLPWNKKATFADESKRIAKKYKGREEDVLAKKTMEIELDKLKDMQETAKNDMVIKAKQMMQMAGVGGQSQHQMPDGSMMQGQQHQMQQPQEQQIPNLGMLQGQMAYGGKIYYNHGGELHPLDNPDMYSGFPNKAIDPFATSYNTYGLPVNQRTNGNVTNANYGVNQFTSTKMENTDSNFIGKTNDQYIDEGINSPNALSRNYTPQEQVQMQGLSNQLAKGDMSQEDYNRAIAGMGLEEADLNASHINPAYRDQFNAQQNQNTNLNPADIGKQMGQQGTGMDSAANNTGINNFNEKLTTGEKVASFIPAAAQAFSLIGGPEKVQYNQMTPEFIDLKNQRTAANKAAAIARLGMNQNSRNIGGNSGRAYSNMVVGNSAIASNLGDQLGQSYLNEATTNTGIANQTNQFNVGIQNAQNDANAANRAKHRDQLLASVINASSAYKGIKKDDRAYTSNNIYNNAVVKNLGSEDFYYDPITGQRKLKSLRTNTNSTV